MARRPGNPLATSPVRVMPLPEPSAPRAQPDATLDELAAASPIRIGFVGYGYWGPNLVRNFSEVTGAQVWSVSDMSEERLALAHARYPAITATTDCHALIRDPAIDAVVITTPVSTHYKLALEALQADKHVLVAKPMAATQDQAIELIEEAERRGRILMVDHTFVYTGAVRRIKELVDSGSLGRLYYYDSVRVNLGLFRNDVNVLWDLAVHDLTIMDYVLGEQPLAVAATGAAHFAGHPVNTGYLTCFFNNDLLAHHHVNWLAPVKVRRTLVCGDRQMIVYDDLEPSEKVKVYDKGVTLSGRPEPIYESLIGYRTGDMWAPKISLTEGLRVEAMDFLECIRQGRRPVSDGHMGLRVIRILEAAALSLVHRGQPVDLPAGEAQPASPLQRPVAVEMPAPADIPVAVDLPAPVPYPVAMAAAQQAV
jgi:predicted dehydrogenase